MTMTKRAINHANWPVQDVLAFSTTRHLPGSLSDQEVDQVSEPVPQQTPGQVTPVQAADKNPFQSFNLASHVGDTIENVARNRQTLSSLLPPNANIQWLEQAHGAKALVVEQHSQQAPIGDAMITATKNLALAVMTADCLPILLSSVNGDEIAAIHGGWRPLALGIIENTLAQMVSPPQQICAWLGPCIGEQAFEVGAEVRRAFIDKQRSLDVAFVAIGDNKYLADLALIAQNQLIHLGVKQVQRLPHCTYTQSQHYFSYRREKQTGRMATLICRI